MSPSDLPHSSSLDEARTAHAPATSRRSSSAPPEAANGPNPPRSPQRPAPTPWARSGVLGLALALLVTIIVLAFSWPSVASEPRDLPVDVVGAAPAIAQLQQALETQGSDALALTTVDDRDTAVTRIERRESYGAIVLG